MKQQVYSAKRPSTLQRSVFFTGSGTAVNIVALFGETILAVRLLAPSSYGTYVFLIAIVNFFVMLVDFGGKTAVTQFIASSDRQRQEEIISSSVVFRLAVIGAVSVSIWVTQQLFFQLDPSRALWHYVGYIPLMLVGASLDELFFGMLQGFQAFRLMAIARSGQSLLRICLTVLFLRVAQLGLLGVILSWSFSFAISAAFEYLALPVSKRFSCRWSLVREMLHFGVPLQLTRFLWYVFSQVNVLLVGALAGPVNLAYYGVAMRIPDALQRLSEAYTAVYYPTVTALLAKGERERADSIMNDSLRLLSFASGVMALVAVLFCREIVTLLFSQKYAPSSSVFALLMVAFHMTTMVNLMGYTLTAMARPGRSLIENLIRTTLNILGNVILIPARGIIGAAFAVLVATYIGNPVLVWLLRRSGTVVATRAYSKQTLLLLLCAALFWWLQPVGFVIRIALVVLFITLNLTQGTISRDDIGLILPDRLVRRLRLPKEAFSHADY